MSSQDCVVRSVHEGHGAGLYRVRVRVTTSRMGKEGLIGLLCSQNAHDEKDGKGTHVGPVLPERAP